MTRKTGKMAVKARQLMRAAKIARYKRELAEAGVSLTLPKPTAKARREKEEELRKLYLELFSEKQKPPEEQAEVQEQAEQSGEAEITEKPAEEAQKEKSETPAEEQESSQEPKPETTQSG